MKARGEPREEDVSIAAHLLRLRDPVTKQPLSDELLAGEFGMFFTAGLETSGNAISWTLCAPLLATESPVPFLSLRTFKQKWHPCLRLRECSGCLEGAAGGCLVCAAMQCATAGHSRFW